LQKRSGNRRPFRCQIAGRGLAPRLPIPVAGIVAVAFAPMQIGVDPGAVRTFMTMSCALSQALLPAHHSAVNAGDRPAGGLLPDRLRLNAAGVIA